MLGLEDSLTPTRTQKDWIQTFTGRKFYPFTPQSQDVEIIDIAHALSNLCRFTGHCVRFYSVAEHCVRVSFRAEELGARLQPTRRFELVRLGLMHDAAEAYVNDLARPVKHQPELADYRNAEALVWKAIAEKFGLSSVLPEEIHQADNELLFTERRDLFPYVHPEWNQTVKKVYEPLAHVEIAGWYPNKAEAYFLKRFRELFPNNG